ncbi:hypothetical protein ABVV53_06880 [Novosphingobium sp. RD2P27]|uniref:Uncharacterized protein n=1 Tax=Novosphingobium kalidii TaxID=3230299 RepID=A0ABV2CZY7_9SPHN
MAMWIRYGVVGALGLAGAGMAVAQQAGLQPPELRAAPVVDEAQVQAIAVRLAAAINAEIARMPADSSVEDYEAAMIFILVQDENPLDSMLVALDIVEARPNLSPVVKQAIDNVRAILLRRFRRGTSALLQGGGFSNAGFGAFGGAIVGIGGGGGGGGSNYTQ